MGESNASEVEGPEELPGGMPGGMPDRRRAAALRRELGRWFAAHARDLPWRRTDDPYAIWISEAMLQQTRVETVVPYWTRFLARFPTAHALADAAEEEVLGLWSGLGYYSRARSLHAAARALVERHDGVFPRTLAEARALPGVGPYTAGAVLSIAHDRPEPLVDGNVERVFARWFDLELAAGSTALKRACWDLAAALVPTRGGAGDWNQALMELGATVCTPRAPRCGECPVRARCAAHAAGHPEARPLPKPRPVTVEVELELLLVERRGEVLLERRPPGGRMAGLWQVPTVELGTGTGLFPEDHAPGIELVAEPGEPGVLGELRHAITRHRIRGRVRRARAVGRAAGPYRWFPRAELAELPLTGMSHKVLARFGPGVG